MYVGNGLSIRETAKICGNVADMWEIPQLCGEMA